MLKNKKFAVVGATGAVGKCMLSILEEKGVSKENVFAVASERSLGQNISYGNSSLQIEALSHFDFSKVDIALFSPGSEISKEYAPKAVMQGAIVIDNTSYFRMDPEVPLVVPEVNGHILQDRPSKGIIANPNCSTIQLVMALKPLHDITPIKRVVVSTYQSVSGAGQEAMDELFNTTKSVLMNQPYKSKVFQKPIAFNVIPHIDVFKDDGYTKEEWKMIVETQKILDPSIKVSATCVRVPVFIGHSVCAHVEFTNDFDIKDVQNALKSFKGIQFSNKKDSYPTPIEAAQEDHVYVSRLRKDPSVDFGVCMWIVADNLRKGAALNAVQIAEKLSF